MMNICYEYMLKIHQLLDLRCVDSPAQARFQKVHEEKSPVDVTEYVISVEQMKINFEKDSNGCYTCPENTCKYTTNQGPPNIEHLCSMFDCSFMFGEHSNTRTWF